MIVKNPARAPLLDVAVFGAYAILGILITWPVAKLADRGVPGDLIDSLLVAFIVGWQNHAIVTGKPLAMLTAPIFHPFDKSLLLSEQMLGGSILGLPAWLLTENAVLAANVMILATFPIGAFGMYLLIKDITGSRPAGILAGLAFAFTPYRLSMLWAPHVLLIVWIPYALLHLRRFVLSRRLRNAVFCSLFVVLQVAASGHGALMVGAVIPIVAIVIIALRPFLLRFGRTWIGAAIAAAIVLVGSLPFVLPYQRIYEENPHFERQAGEVAYYSAGPMGLFSAPPNNRLWREKLDFTREVPGTWEKQLFPGFVVPALALIGGMVVLLRGPDRDGRLWGAVFITLGLFGILMSLGTSQKLDRPFGFFASHVPGFDRTRVPGRFSVVSALGMAGLAGTGVAHLGSILRQRKSWMEYLPILVVLPMLFEAWPLPFAPARPPEPSPAYAWLSEQPPSPVLELPTGQRIGPGVDSFTLQREARHVYFVTHHWHPILNGYGGNLPPSYISMVQKVQEFPDEKSIGYLRATGVRYVIVHRDLIGGTPWEDVEQRVRNSRPDAIVREHTGEFVIDLRRLST